MIIVHLLLILSLLFTFVCMALIGLVHAQPYENRELQDLFTPPEGCPMPCFMGIRPGVTTADEAMAVLEAHEWVEQPLVLVATDGRGIHAITADWSGQQPTLIDSDESLWMGVEEDIVQRVVVATTIRLGDVWLSLGSPQFGAIFEATMFGGPAALYYGAYLEPGFSFSTGWACPIHSIWRLQTLWIIGSGVSSLDSASEDTVPNHVYAACRRLMVGR